MGVDHIVNKANKNNSYTPKWLTWLMTLLAALPLLIDLIIATLEMTALLLGSYWSIRLLEVTKESCLILF